MTHYHNSNSPSNNTRINSSEFCQYSDPELVIHLTNLGFRSSEKLVRFQTYKTTTLLYIWYYFINGKATNVYNNLKAKA